jgi:hypothetical protein
MRRLTVGAAIASLAIAGTAGPAAAKKGAPKPAKSHTILRADLSPVAVAPPGVVIATRGKARLDAGAKRDRLGIHARNLQPGVTYAWHLHKAAAAVTDPCAAPPADAAPVAGWTFGKLTANQDGNANAQGASSTFSVEPGATYYVDVHLVSGEVVLCGVLHGKPEKLRPAKPKRGKGKDHTDPTPTPAVSPLPPVGGTAGGDPFVVNTPPGGSPTPVAGSTSPAPATGDQNDQGDGNDDSASARAGRRGHGKGHSKPGRGAPKH